MERDQGRRREVEGVLLVVLVLGLLADKEHHRSEKVLFSSSLNKVGSSNTEESVTWARGVSCKSERTRHTTRASAAILRVS